MNRRGIRRLAVAVLLCCLSKLSIALDWNAELALETTLFTESALHSGQAKDPNISLSFQPEFYTDWNNRDQSLEFIPFFRADQQDSERTHLDIRELAWTRLFDEWELRAGISRVFWGVTEFQHLVDVINQTDSVENLDAEDKLGQPMLLLTSVRDWGTVEFFVLPYFRERTFAGEDGRLRTAFVVDTDLTEYESSAEQNHLDVALRYSHYLGDWDFGVAHFSGTNREPILNPAFNSQGELVLAPYYEQMEQTSLTLQATKEAALWKLEALHRVSDSAVHNALVGGLEYSFYGVGDSTTDLGLILEYHYDDRGEDAPSIFEDDIALGARLAFNDAQSSELLAGALIDASTGGVSFSLEGSRRLTNNLSLAVESRLFFDLEPEDLAYSLVNDDFIRLNLYYNF